MSKKKQVVYKVVLYDPKENKMLSLNTARKDLHKIPKEMLLEYKMRRTCYPIIGKIFCFESAMKAMNWADVCIHGGYKVLVLKGTANSCEKPPMSRVLGTEKFGAIKQYWATVDSDPKRIAKNWSGNLWNIPIGTVVCDSFTPHEKVELRGSNVV